MIFALRKNLRCISAILISHFALAPQCGVCKKNSFRWYDTLEKRREGCQIREEPFIKQIELLDGTLVRLMTKIRKQAKTIKNEGSATAADDRNPNEKTYERCKIGHRRSLSSSGSRGGGGGAGTRKKKKRRRRRKKKEKKIGPGIHQVRPPQHNVWGALECTAALCMSTRTYKWILKKWWRHTGINILEECCWVDRWMHDFLHVEHLFFDLPDLPGDFKYFVKIVNICTNYLANSLSDFSEIIPQNSEKCISAHRNFQNFPGEHAPGPPRGGEGRPSQWSRSDHKFWGLRIPRPPPPPPWLKSWIRHCWVRGRSPENKNKGRQWKSNETNAKTAQRTIEWLKVTLNSPALRTISQPVPNQTSRNLCESTSKRLDHWLARLLNRQNAYTRRTFVSSRSQTPARLF